MEIYAEISNKLASQIDRGIKFCVPDGVTANKLGRRSYIFHCDEHMKEELVDFLEAKGISWQDND